MLAHFASLLARILNSSKKPSPVGSPAADATKSSWYYTWEKGRDMRLSSYFYANEFECKCSYSSCRDQKISVDLVAKLTKIRAELGSPIIVTSGFRCQEKQKELINRGYEAAPVGTSQHEQGKAADITPLDKTKLVELKNLAAEHFMALGLANTFVHVDMRNDKIRRWKYGS